MSCSHDAEPDMDDVDMEEEEEEAEEMVEEEEAEAADVEVDANNMEMVNCREQETQVGQPTAVALGQRLEFFFTTDERLTQAHDH